MTREIMCPLLCVILFTRTSSLHAQSRRLRMLSRCFAAKIAYEEGGYVVTQRRSCTSPFLQASLTYVLVQLRYRVNSNAV